MSQNIKTVLLHTFLIFITTFGAGLALNTADFAHLSTMTSLVMAACVAGVSAAAHYLSGLVPSLAIKTGAAASPLGNPGSIALHCVLVFVVTFAGQLAAISSSHASYSTLTALATSAAITAVVAVAHYLSGLIPGSATILTASAPKGRS